MLLVAVRWRDVCLSCRFGGSSAGFWRVLEEARGEGTLVQACVGVGALSWQLGWGELRWFLLPVIRVSNVSYHPPVGGGSAMMASGR